MGMAASQARLLSLTSRLHDVEYKAQNIEQQKIALATQEDTAYQEYCDALDATKFQVAYRGEDGSTNYQSATFSSLCGFNEERLKQYALKDNKTGNIIVSSEVAENYEEFSDDKYSFAWAMMGLGDNFNWEASATTSSDSGKCVGIGTSNDKENPSLKYIEESDGTYSLYMSECEQMVYDEYCGTDSELKEKYDAIGEAESKSDKKEALNTFRDDLYKKYSNEIFELMNINKQGTKGVDTDVDYPDMNWDSSTKNEFNYYTKLWETINEAGGCQAINKEYESGETGATWLKNMVEAGLITIQVYNDTGSKKGWNDTSVTTSVNENYLQEVQDDTDLKAAEIKYEHELSIINKKDQRYDNELNKLETERNAITTELDAIKEVRDNNVERTFGIFS